MLDLVAFGEILWDVIDGEAHIGGAPFNLAAHAVRCGVRAAAVSCVGDDSLGREALQEMTRLRVDGRWTTVDGAHPTGTVTVALKDGQPSYTIHEGVAWDFIQPAEEAFRALAAECPRAFCFGSLAQRSAVSRATLFRLLDAFKGATVFYDVNLRQSYWSAPLVEAGLARATLVKVNDDEARVLGGLLFGGACDPEAFARAVLARHPVKAVIVTLGAAGCLVCERGREPVRCAGVNVDVVDTVGAGDAFSAAFLAAWLAGATAAEAAAAGNARGAWVASQRGAVPEEPVGQASSPVPFLGLRTQMSGETPLGQAGKPVLRGRRQAGTPVLPFKPFSPGAVRTTHRRHLPHWSQSGVTYFVTWRLADSVPQAVLAEWREARDQWLVSHPQPWDSVAEEEYWKLFVQRFDERLNDGAGSCLMRDANVAAVVEQSLLHFEGEKYTLWRYVIMPNHVHVLVTPSQGVGLSSILHGWKGYTAKEMNRLRGASGNVWQDETFDHIVRTESQLAKFVRYIEDNPRKAHVAAVVGPEVPPELP
jgi:fructokinase